MPSFLDNLRNKSNKEKRAFALLSSAILAGVIFIIWLLTVLATWDSRFDFKNEESEKTAEMTEVEVSESQPVLPTVPLNIEWSTTTLSATSSVAE